MAESQTTRRNEWEDLKKFATYTKTFTGAATALVTALPLAGAALSSIVPPWPPGSYVVAALGSLVLVLALFFTHRESDEAALPKRQTALLLCVLALLGFAVYISLLAKLMVTVGEERHLTGFGLTDQAQKAVNDNLVANDPKDLLDYFGHESEDQIWKYRTVAKLLLLFSFCGSFMLMASCFAQFMIRNYVRDNRMRGAGGSPTAALPAVTPTAQQSITGQGTPPSPQQK
jgi:hypothetical protein